MSFAPEKILENPRMTPEKYGMYADSFLVGTF